MKGRPDQVWPVVKDFWQETGFIVNVEMPEAGVMETDWTENRARISDPGFIRGILGKLLDQVYSTSERDKFRTRLERGAEPGTTEIYISHRGMEEVSTTSAQEQTKWQPRPADPELEAEMLRRLMVRFGVQEARAKSAGRHGGRQRGAARDAVEGRQRTAPARSPLNEQFDRAWRASASRSTAWASPSRTATAPRASISCATSIRRSTTRQPESQAGWFARLQVLGQQRSQARRSSSASR